jgi:DNA primase
LCPFHSEKTPSFTVHEPRQFFHCFGCDEKGDVISFLVKVEQRPFMDVLTDLATAAGVDLDIRPLTPAERRARHEAESERDRMFRALDLAASYFEQQYLSPAGAAARAYVESRGIGQEVRDRFRVGYAPSRWDGLSSYLADQKIPASVLEQLGLVGVNERGRYDFFRDRVMLPVIDRQKRVIGFGGRLLDPEAKDRKYVNSPESPLFHKKESLYGLHAALDAIRRSGTAIVVEGNFDVLALHQAGIEEAVAPMGTALTPEQLKLLETLAKRIIVVFDGDGAGMRAANKSISELASLSNADLITGVRIARLERGLDPDDFIRAEGAEKFRHLLEAARPFLDQLIHEAAQDPSIPGRLESVERIAQVLVKVSNPTVRELYASQAAGVLGLTKEQVTRALREAAAQAARVSRPSMQAAEAAVAAAPPVAAAHLPSEELHLLVLLVSHPELMGNPETARAGQLLVDPSLRRAFRVASEQIAADQRIDVPAWLESASPEVRATLAAAMMDRGISSAPDPAAQLRKLAIKLETMRVDAEMTENERQLREARTRGDEATIRALSVRGIELRQTKEGLRSASQRP